MKIAFWSEQEDVETTFHLAVTACAAVFLYPVSIAVVSGGYHDEGLEQKFFGMEKCPIPASQGEAGYEESMPFGMDEIQNLTSQGENGYRKEAFLAAETQEFFLTRGLDCLLGKAFQENLTKEIVKANMRQVVKDRMYCLPASARPRQEWWHQDCLFARLDCVMGAVEDCFDVVFIDCGSRKDDYARKLLREADVCVLNMNQEAEVIGDFYRNPPGFRGEIFFLLGNYFADGLYNRKNLERIYRMDESRLGAIPYNPWLQAASSAGRTDCGVKHYVDRRMKGKNVEFEKELIRTTSLILKLAGVME